MIVELILVANKCWRALVDFDVCNTLKHTAPHCNILQHTECNAVRHAATNCNKLTATHCSTLQHTHHNALQHTATLQDWMQHTATHCNTLQHTATLQEHSARPSHLQADIFKSQLAIQVTELHDFVLQCVVVCCSVLQCVAVCYIQCVAVCCSARYASDWRACHCVAVCCSVLHSVCCSVLQCVAVWCSVLQCVAVCCSVLQCVAVCYIHWIAWLQSWLLEKIFVELSAARNERISQNWACYEFYDMKCLYNWLLRNFCQAQCCAQRENFSKIGLTRILQYKMPVELTFENFCLAWYIAQWKTSRRVRLK